MSHYYKALDPVEQQPNSDTGRNRITINGVETPVPTGAIAYKHSGPTEGARWVYASSDYLEIASQDPGLLVTVDPFEPTHKVIINGRSVDFDAVVNLMDEKLREHLHSTVADYDQDDPSSYQNFVNAYCVAHAEKFGEDFRVD